MLYGTTLQKEQLEEKQRDPEMELLISAASFEGSAQVQRGCGRRYPEGQKKREEKRSCKMPVHKRNHCQHKFERKVHRFVTEKRGTQGVTSAGW